VALKLPKIIDQRSVKKMLAQINIGCPTGCRNYAIIIMMYRAGLRVSEICKLTLSDVNFETKLIYIQQSKGRDGKKKDRYVPMDNDIIRACQEWLQVRPESNYFFCTLEGNIMDQRYIREVCYRISEKAGVYIQDGAEKKPVSPHKLRHTFLTECLREGDFNIREVQELAGHSSVATTQVYTHVVMDELQEKIMKRKGISIENLVQEVENSPIQQKEVKYKESQVEKTPFPSLEANLDLMPNSELNDDVLIAGNSKSINYNPLWVLLAKERMKRTDLKEKIGISGATLAKMGKDEYVSMEVLDRLCSFFNCQLSDIIEYNRM
jgi:DNA-binding Xre family transcriptional regulator